MFQIGMASKLLSKTHVKVVKLEKPLIFEGHMVKLKIHRTHIIELYIDKLLPKIKHSSFNG